MLALYGFTPPRQLLSFSRSPRPLPPATRGEESAVLVYCVLHAIASVATSAMSTGCKRLRTDHRFCPHCNELLSYKTFRAHKRLYYDEHKDEWYHVSARVSEGVPAEHVAAEDEIPPSAQEFEPMEAEPSYTGSDDEVPSPPEC